MVRRLALAAVAAVVGMAFLMAPATAGSTVTKMHLKLGEHDVAARSQVGGSVGLWAKVGSSWVPVAGATLAVMVDGRLVATVVTNAGGVAEVSAPSDLTPGGHVMKVIYAGDGVFSRTQRAHGFSVSAESPSCTVPDAPMGDRSDTTSGSVTVFWVPPTNDGGCAITAYNVYRGPDFAGSAPGTATSFTDPVTPPSGLHFYYVSAVNAAGESNLSNEILVSI
jgi:hypothetical protein